jgi:hypothetical protein
MQDFTALVLASLAASYEAPVVPVDDGTVSVPDQTVIARNISVKQAKALINSTSAVPASPVKEDDGSQAAPANDTPILGLVLPEAGMLQARGFLMAMRSAGVRKGKLDASVKREDEIRAIAAYCGYDTSKLHGEQEQAARAKAQRDLKPIVIAPTDKAWTRTNTVDPTITGYVQGKFDAIDRRIADLRGREVTAAEALCAHRIVFMNVKLTTEERAKASLLMKLEEERIAQIRADLHALGEEV